MKGSHTDKESGLVRVELKYCERCGGLWVREGGAGVYCEKCQNTIADLPIPRRKRTGGAMLPVRRRSTLEDDFEMELPDDSTPDLEAAGGVA